MPEGETVRLLILVKAAPVIVSNTEEAVCVGAMTLDGTSQWVRLFPIPFRDLDDDQRFAKYQEISLQIIPARGDPRPESRTPIQGTIRPGRKISPGQDWYEREAHVSLLSEHSMCDLLEMQKERGVHGTPSLAVVRAIGKPELVIREFDDLDKRRWQERADAAAAQQSLFGDSIGPRRPLEVPEWKFKYCYYCEHPSCSSHTQTIIDWEIAALWRKVRDQDDWRDKMKEKLVDEMWAPTRDTRLFVGNQKAHPRSYLVLGVFWPPAVSTLF